MKILLAETQKIHRQLLLNALEKYSATTLKASDNDSLKILLQQEADFLILDFLLVGPQLQAFIEEILVKYPHLKILLTAYPENLEAYVEWLEQKNIPFLKKPFLERQIDQKLEEFLNLTEASDNQLSPKRIYDLEALPSAQKHPSMRKAIGFLHHVADSDITVLITGESGVGKEIYSQTLHHLSKRRSHPFVGINCASIPASLLEAELFGYERGAFTGAMNKRLGKFELAQKGTLLLDEITEMDLSLQSKLLRVIQEKELYRVGGHQKISLDVRILATTNRDLKESVRKKEFREDLYYRLNVISVRIPPLRERLEDIPILVHQILNRFMQSHPDKELVLSNQAMDQLLSYSWPGNIRELDNILTRSIYLSSNNQIDQIYFDDTEPEHLSSSTSFSTSSSAHQASGPIQNIKEVERQMIFQALEHHHGNRMRASHDLGISVRTLRNKLKIYREEGLSLPSCLQEDDFEEKEVCDGPSL